MVVTPNSRIRLLKSPIELDNKNQLTFSSEQNQRNYFLSLPYLEYDNCSYQRKDGVIRYETGNNPGEITYEDLLEYNYCMYQNEHYSNKWFYAFITEVKYINDGMTEIKIETDVMQSWKFEINYKPSFIEREHVNDDTIGAHTIPENLEMGDYIDQSVSTEEAKSFNFLQVDGRAPLIVIACSDVKITGFDPGIGRRYSNIYSGLIYLTFPNEGAAETFMFYTATQFSESPIVAVFLAPVPLANPNLQWRTASESAGGQSYQFTYNEVPYSATADYMMSPSLSKTNFLDDNYIPKNKKLLTYPFKYFIISNNAGSNAEYKYELFSTSSCNFQINGAIGVGCSIKLQPNSYNKKSGLNPLFSLDAGKLPTCGWINDAYTNWLTGNAVNIGLQLGTDIAKVGVGAFTENPGIIANSALSIANTLGEVYQRSKIPLTAQGGVNQGDFNYAWKLSFSVYRKSIKREYAKIIDDYFSAYGYKVNSYKKPNIEGRTNWNYIKTIGLNITGNIPQEDMQKIKDIYDNGVTLWHNPSTFLDYSQSNNII